MNKLILSSIFAMLFSSTALANDYEFGSFKVSKMRFGSGSVSITLNPAPTGCGGGNQYRMHLKVNDTDPIAYKDMVSGLLSAHATGQKIEVLWYSNKGVCSNSNILTLNMFEFAAK